jgi:hypothetical protein
MPRMGHARSGPNTRARCERQARRDKLDGFSLKEIGKALHRGAG